MNIGQLVDASWGKQGTDWMMLLFHTLVRRKAPCVVGEIGMRGGVSTAAWLIACRDYGGKVYSMDIERNETALASLEEFGLTGLTFIHGDSKEAEFPEPLDILFIDGDHTYEGVSIDRKRHGAMVKPGGVILYHDTVSEPAVGLYVRERGIADIPIGMGLGIEVLA